MVKQPGPAFALSLHWNRGPTVSLLCDCSGPRFPYLQTQYANHSKTYLVGFLQWCLGSYG